MIQLVIEMEEVGYALNILDCVFNQIKEGNTSGIDPTWYFESDENLYCKEPSKFILSQKQIDIIQNMNDEE